MAAYKFEGFKGKNDLLSLNLRDPMDALTATEVFIQGGKLSAMKQDVSVSNTPIAGTQTLFKYNDVWMAWDEDVDAVNTLNPDDPYGRVLWTVDDGVTPPQVADVTQIMTGGAPYPNDSHDLGVTAPTGYPTVQKLGTPDDPSDIADSRYYICTFVNTWGEESAPGFDASALPTQLEVKPGEYVRITAPSAPVDDHVVKVRIYRSVTGSSDSEFMYVGEALPTATFDDDLDSDLLVEALSTQDFDKPPSTMIGLKQAPNGYNVGFYGNVICFSEPGFEYAWPAGYQLKVPYPVVAVEPLDGNMILVTTTSFPYIIHGSLPGNSSLERIDNLYPCVSKHSMYGVNGYAVYASSVGLIKVGVDGTVNLTEKLMDIDAWQAYKPETMKIGFWKTVLLLTSEYVTGTTYGTVTINPIMPEIGFVDLLDSNHPIRSKPFYNSMTEELFFANAAGNIYNFSASGTKVADAEWVSSHVYTGDDTIPAAAHVRGDANPPAYGLRIGQINTSDVFDAIYDISVTTHNPFWLPAETAAWENQNSKLNGVHFVLGLNPQADEKISAVYLANGLAELYKG